jgi:DNA-binding NarL/FixJ family response regulator
MPRDVFLPPGHEAWRSTSSPERRREVLQLLAEDRAMKEIADFLHATARTVAFHKYTIMEHLGLKNERRTGAICPRARNVEKTQLVFA